MSCTGKKCHKVMFRFRIVWNTDINLIFILMKLSNLHNSPLNVQSTIPIKKIIFNSCAKKFQWNSWRLSLKNAFQNVWTAHRTPTEEIQFTAKTSLLLPDPFTHPPQLPHTYKIQNDVKKNTECKNHWAIHHPLFWVSHLCSWLSFFYVSLPL